MEGEEKKKAGLSGAGGRPNSLLNPLKRSDQRRWTKDLSPRGHPVVLVIMSHLSPPDAQTIQFCEGHEGGSEEAGRLYRRHLQLDNATVLFFLQRAVNTASVLLLGLLPGDQTANGALQRLGKTDIVAAVNLTNAVSQAKD